MWSSTRGRSSTSSSSPSSSNPAISPRESEPDVGWVRPSGNTVPPHQVAGEPMREAMARHEMDGSPNARSSIADTQDLLSEVDVDVDVERSAGRVVGLVAVAAVIVALVAAAIIFRELMLLALAVLFVIPFLMLVSSTPSLARTSSEAPDPARRERRDGQQRPG